MLRSSAEYSWEHMRYQPDTTMLTTSVHSRWESQCRVLLNGSNLRGLHWSFLSLCAHYRKGCRALVTIDMCHTGAGAHPGAEGDAEGALHL